MDRWQSKVIPCTGGLLLNIDALTQGTQFPGSARMLQNFESSLDGGYRRISGYTKYDDDVVPGSSTNPILGVKVGFNGVFACRKTVNDNRIYFGTGAGWTQVSTAARNGSVAKARFLTYSIIEPVIIQVDGVNPAWKWDGSTETTINGTGAPANPKYAAIFRNRLVLAGYDDGSKISLSAPDDDEDFDGVSGAIEINVGDTVTALKNFRDNLVIFCERSIKVLVGTTTADFTIEHISEAVGCLGQDTVQELGGDLIYLSTDSLRSFAATMRIGDVALSSVSQSIQPIISAILSENLDADVYSACCIRNKGQYRLFLNNPDTTELDTLGILGRLQDTPTVPHGNFEWSTLKGIKPYCADSDFTNNQEIAVIGHPSNGYVYRLESGNTFDGNVIHAIYKSPDLTFDDATVRKVFHKASILTQLEGNVDTNVNLILDRGDINIIQPSSISLVQSGTTAVYGIAVYDTDTYGAFIYPVFKRNLIGSGFLGAFQFTSTTDTSAYRIDSYQVTFSVKGRR